MKKIAILLCVLLTIAMLTACLSSKDSISVLLVDGAPLLSMTYMMSEDFAGIDGIDLTFTKTNDVDTIVAALLNGEPDFAIAPINIAAMMYNNGSGYRLAAITIWGIMQIVSDKDVSTLEELKGETIVAFGRNGTPGITLRAVLEQNNIEYNEPDSTSFSPDPNKVNIVYLTAASDVRDAIATGMEIGGNPVSFGLLAEPVATAITGFAANAGREGFTAKIDLQEQWAKNNNGEIYPQAALIFHERLLTEKADLVSKFIAEAEQSSIFANNNPEEAGDLAVALGSIAIPNGTIVRIAYEAGRLPMSFTRAIEAKSAVNTFLHVLFNENPNLTGGTIPSDGFYYEFPNP